MNENIEKLRQVTEQLNDGDFDVSFDKKVSIRINSDSGKGSIMMSELYSQPFVDVSLVLMTAGAAMRNHTHGVKQTIHVFEGAVNLTTDDGTIKLTPGDVQIIEKSENHSLESIEDSWVVLVNLPSESALANRFK